MSHSTSGKLGPLLCWAVVFADIGTSVYYVPGILHDSPGIGSLAGAFVLLVSVACAFLAVKYAEISARYEEGGGVVTVATSAFGPLVGCLGGVLMVSAYFLTSSISAMSGIRYLDSVVHLGDWTLPVACVAVLLLGCLNLIGIKESASVTLTMALSGLVTQLLVVLVVAAQLSRAEWAELGHRLVAAGDLGPKEFLKGFGAAWLAYSGLESLSQLSAAMREPRRKVAFVAMALVMGSVLVTSPLLTTFSTTLLGTRMSGTPRSDSFISELGFAFGGTPLRVAVVLAGSTLLVFAANTAIIGCYHIFLALTKQSYLPAVMARRNRRFGTPHVAIAVATLVPLAILLATRGNIDLLGDLYAFGLLGAFLLSSAGLDKVRWHEGARGPGFWLGVLTTVVVLVAWGVNIVAKHLATIYGGAVVVVGMGFAVAVRRGHFARLEQVGYWSEEAAEAEAAELPTALQVLTLAEALDLKTTYNSQTMVCVRGVNQRLLAEGAARARGTGDKALYVMFVDEVPGLFYPPKTGPSDEARDVLRDACALVEKTGITAIPVWRMAHDAGESIASAAERLKVNAVFVGTTQRTAIWHLLRGNVLKTLVRKLPEETRLTIVN